MAFRNSAPPNDIDRLVEQVGQGLKHKRPYGEAVRAAAESMVPTLADFAVAFVRREGGREYVEVAHVDPARRADVRDRITEAHDLLCRAAVASTGQQWLWMPTMAPAALRRLSETNDALPRLVRSLSIHSLIVVPLRSGGRIHGALAMARTTAGHPFTAAELAVAQTVARRAAVAIETAEVAEGIQTNGARRAGLDDALRKWIRVFHEAAWGAAIVDGEDYRIDVANPGFAAMHGWTNAAALTGCPFAELLPDGRGEAPPAWGRVPGEHTLYETTHVRADGSTFPARINATYLGGGDGTCAYVVTVQDLTTLKRTEERLHRAQRMEAVGRLAGGVAHEVSNMITIILGFADILGSKGLPDEQRGDLDEIRKAAVRAGNITRQLLAFSRQRVLQPSALQLNEVVAEMTPVLRLMLPANVRLETTLSASGGSVRADRAQLEQVLINLAFNARDAMPDGGTIRLTTAFHQLDATTGERFIGIPIVEGAYGLLSVTDTGSGMDPTTLNQIFDPFFTTKPMGHGTGLGLATVYGIVKQSDGYIWAESAVGEGTTVTVCLPEVEESTAMAAASPTPAPRRTTGTVLLVEDEEGVRQLASRILQQMGFQVLEAPTGAAALSHLDGAERPVDLVVTDVVVPDIELSRLERRARDRQPDLPILYMSGYPYEEIVERGLIAASQPFLQKPFTAAELMERIHEVVGDRRRARR